MEDRLYRTVRDANNGDGKKTREEVPQPSPRRDLRSRDLRPPFFLSLSAMTVLLVLTGFVLALAAATAAAAAAADPAAANATAAAHTATDDDANLLVYIPRMHSVLALFAVNGTLAWQTIVLSAVLTGMPVLSDNRLYVYAVDMFSKPAPHSGRSLCSTPPLAHPFGTTRQSILVRQYQTRSPWARIWLL